MSHFDRHFYRSQPVHIRHIPFAHDGLRWTGLSRKTIDAVTTWLCVIGVVVLWCVASELDYRDAVAQEEADREKIEQMIRQQYENERAIDARDYESRT